jgi:DNA-binding response OmpR family regulator
VASARILVVDDDPKFLHFVSELLIGAGYDVHCTGEPLRTVEMAEALIPDLVVLDISMPGKDGFQLAQDLRANAKTKSIRIMFLTGHPLATNPKKVKEVRGIAYLQKPFQSTNLIRIVKALLPPSRQKRLKPF